MKIGLIVNPTKEKVFPRVQNLLEWLVERDCEVLYERHLKLNSAPNTRPANRTEMGRDCDVVVVFGGDGTLLDASHEMVEYDTPILGVNSGGLGFLTETTLDEMHDSLDRILSGDYEVQKRMMLAANREERDGEPLEALNDMVLSRVTLGRVIQIAAFVDGAFVTSYVCDGLIVSSPTGSTAYNLSANGPIVHPDLNSLILNPICPHTLTNRPLILPADSEITLKIESSDECILTADGQDKIDQLQQGDVLSVWRADREVTLIRPKERDFFTILRTKLHWSGRTSE